MEEKLIDIFYRYSDEAGEHLRLIPSVGLVLMADDIGLMFKHRTVQGDFWMPVYRDKKFQITLDGAVYRLGDVAGYGYRKFKCALETLYALAALGG